MATAVNDVEEVSLRRPSREINEMTERREKLDSATAILLLCYCTGSIQV